MRQGISSAGPNSNDLHDRIVGRVERELIQQVLQTCDRVQIKAAARLGINRNTLHKKLAEYRIDESDAGPGVVSPGAAGGHRNSNGSFDDADSNEPDKDDSHPRAGSREPLPVEPLPQTQAPPSTHANNYTIWNVSSIENPPKIFPDPVERPWGKT